MIEWIDKVGKPLDCKPFLEKALVFFLKNLKFQKILSLF